MPSLVNVGTSGYQGPSGFSGITGDTGDVIRSQSDFRLTLESGVAVSSSNQTTKTILYLTPYLGNRLSLYYGSSWNSYESDEIPQTLSGLTANKNHDVFAFYTGSDIGLELVEWTNDTTRATSLVRQDGVYSKSGNTTRRYIGTIRTTGTTGQCEDSFTSRYVWNMFNRVKRWGFTTNTNVSWTYSVATWREYNNGSGQLRFKFVLGFPQIISLQMNANSTGTGYVGCALDTTTTYTLYWYMTSSAVLYGHNLSGYNYLVLNSGYHYLTQVEYCNSGTLQNYTNGSATYPNYGTTALLES